MAILYSPKKFCFWLCCFHDGFYEMLRMLPQKLVSFFTSQLHLFSLCSYSRRLIILLKKLFFLNPKSVSKNLSSVLLQCVQSFIDHSEKSQRQFNSKRRKQSKA